MGPFNIIVALETKRLSQKDKHFHKVRLTVYTRNRIDIW